MSKEINTPINDPTYEGVRVDVYLSHITGESRSVIKENEENIYINGVLVKPSTKLKLKDVVTFNYNEKERELPPTLVPQEIPLNIVYEDDDLLVVNKPYGMVVHPAKGNWEGTLSNALAFYLNIKTKEELRPGIVHRLDKNTSGLMVVAKTSKAQKGLMELFKTRRVLKVYTALVSGHLTHSYAKIDAPIARHPQNRLLFAVNEQEGRSALTEYKVLNQFKKASLLSVRIHTGRTHQIRVHLAHKGNPIVGDTAYGSSYTRFPLCLVAQKLAFVHPITGKELSFSIEVPPYMQEVIEFFQKKD